MAKSLPLCKGSLVEIEENQNYFSPWHEKSKTFSNGLHVYKYSLLYLLCFFSPHYNVSLLNNHKK